MQVLQLILPWLLFLSVCHGYRFLGLFPFHGKSHFVFAEQLMKGLARKNHQVDVVSTFPLKKPYPNYNDILKLTPPANLVNNVTYDFMKQLLSVNPVYLVATLAGNEVCEYLEHPVIQELVRNPPKDPPYDAVIIEVFGAQCLGIVAHLLNVPLIGISTTSLYPWLHQIVAQPENIAFVPNSCLSFTSPMNFWQRLYNSVHTLFNQFYFNYLTRVQDNIIRKNFGPDMPGVREVESEIALILINSHIALNPIQSKTPATVDVGGLHIQDEDSKLKPELEKWMNDSKDGFIYFTFGSMVMIETFPHQFLKIFYSSLRKIAPVRVLMKVPHPDKLPPGLPENIYTSPWMPQIKVLHYAVEHPNIRAFITHGGLMGSLEAVAFGVPMIGIPLFADQFLNIDTYVARNVAIKLDIDSITEEQMDTALNEILWNPRYRETVRNLSRRFLDQPLNAVDTANYWIEYVVKYGKNALRSHAMDFNWWQLNLIDVIAFIFLSAVVVVIIAIFVVRTLMEIMNGNYKNSSYSKKTN